MVEETHLEDLANNIPDVWLQFLLAIQRYRQASDNTV